VRAARAAAPTLEPAAMTASPGYPPGFVAGLEAIVGSGALLQGEAVAAIHPGVEPRNLGARLLVRPASTAVVAEVLALCSAARVGVVAHGGRTGLAGGAVSRPGELILSLERMNRIESVEPAAQTATVEAGVTLERLAEALAPHGLGPGIDLAARGSATIGGMVATNAGGIDAFRRGTMRERVLGLEAVLASGEVVGALSRVRKDNAGLPLRQLFIGSEGTLGIVTRVVLALVRLPRVPARTILASVPDLGAAVALLRALEAVPGAELEAAELMSANHVRVTARALGVAGLADAAPGGFAVLFSISNPTATGEDALEAALGEASDAGRLTDVVLPKNAAEERDVWRVREDWAVDRVHPGGLWFDVSVPLDALSLYLAALIERVRAHDAALEVYVIGHLGDGNLHVTVNAATPIGARYAEISALIYAGLAELGGSFSAEHGIGLEKREALEHWVGAANLSLMRGIKDLFDPAGILNPGKVLAVAPSPDAGATGALPGAVGRSTG
jgi:FAD/FMN-containing dehydrogenase